VALVTVFGVGLAGCSGNGGNDDGGGDGDGGGSDDDDGSGGGDGSNDVDPASVCADPSGDDLEAMLPSKDYNSDEIEPFTPRGDGGGGGTMENTSDGESTDYDYDYQSAKYGADGGQYHALVLEFPTEAPPSIMTDELYKVGFGDGDFEDDDTVVYALLGSFLFMAGGPEEDMSRTLLGKFSALSEDCANAANVVHGTTSS
jgi:hypothetical protein